MFRGVAIVVLAFTATAHAQVYRCTGASGKTEFSDAPCPPSAREAQMLRPAPSPAERALQQENERLRRQLLEEQNRRLRAENAVPPKPQAPSAPAPQVGRTAADLQAERAGTYECEQAKRNYEVALSSISRHSTAESAKLSMYSACGIQPPNETKIEVRTAPGSSTCVKTGNVLHCS
jgi:hypothetical protein